MKRKIVWWTLSVLWCLMIFYQSGKPALQSGKESMAVVDAVNGFLSSLAGIHVQLVTDRFVRKTSHFLEYFVLGCLFYNALKFKDRPLKTFLYAFAAGVLYAATDELHQHFVPGRAMLAFDVMIDSAGVLLGASIFLAREKLGKYAE